MSPPRRSTDPHCWWSWWVGSRRCLHQCHCRPQTPSSLASATSPQLTEERRRLRHQCPCRALESHWPHQRTVLGSRWHNCCCCCCCCCCDHCPPAERCHSRNCPAFQRFRATRTRCGGSDGDARPGCGQRVLHSTRWLNQPAGSTVAELLTENDSENRLHRRLSRPGSPNVDHGAQTTGATTVTTVTTVTEPRPARGVWTACESGHGRCGHEAD